MSTTKVPTQLTPNAPTPAVQRRSVWKHGISAAFVASVATTILAAITSAAPAIASSSISRTMSDAENPPGIR